MLRAILAGQQRRTLGEVRFPAGLQGHAAVRNVAVNQVVPIRALERRQKRQVQQGFVPPHPPDIRLVAREPRAVNAALLPRADPNRLPARGKANGVGLRVFERDERENQVVLRALANLAHHRHGMLQQAFVNLCHIAWLLERDAEHLLALHQRGFVGLADL
ncbi:hypothetical protein SDC9_181891 [bioreactor metagenome]|uniref:Uncharacterized protein n=1 Tax=bioreactor metagenome TaxID=1076179 RepID=A0A645H5Y6_9ZZZZ